MPPLQEAPGSYYAELDSEEVDGLLQRAQTGEFDIWGAVTEDQNNYLVFSKKGELPQIALLALMAEIGESVTAQQQPQNLSKKNLTMLGKTSILNN